MRLLRARAAWLFGIVLALAGALPVLYFLALLGWQFARHLQAGSWVALPASLLFTDHSFPVYQPVTWFLDRLHVGLVFAVPGLALMALGALMAIRQTAVVRSEKRLREDRLRRVRVRQYRGEADRLEPFIGPGGIAEPLTRKKEAA